MVLVVMVVTVLVVMVVTVLVVAMMVVTLVVVVMVVVAVVPGNYRWFYCQSCPTLVQWSRSIVHLEGLGPN